MTISACPAFANGFEDVRFCDGKFDTANIEWGFFGGDFVTSAHFEIEINGLAKGVFKFFGRAALKGNHVARAKHFAGEDFAFGVVFNDAEVVFVFQRRGKLAAFFAHGTMVQQGSARVKQRLGLQKPLSRLQERGRGESNFVSGRRFGEDAKSLENP